MAQILFHGYTSQFLPTASLTLPAFAVISAVTSNAIELKKYRIGLAGNGSGTMTFFIAVSNAAATGNGTSTAATLSQVSGRVSGLTQIVANFNYTVARPGETYTVVDVLTMQNNATIIYDYPPGDEPDGPANTSGGGNGIFLFFAAGTPTIMTVDFFVSRI